LIIPDFQIGIANMPIEETKKITVKLGNQDIPKKKISFEITPLMSTYLIGIAVGEFDSTERFSVVKIWPKNQENLDDIDKNTLATKNVKIRIFTPLGRSEEVFFFVC